MLAASTWRSLPRTAPPTASSAWPLIPWPAAPTPTLAGPAAGGPQPRPQERASHIGRQGGAPSAHSLPARAAAPPAASEARCTRPPAPARPDRPAPRARGTCPRAELACPRAELAVPARRACGPTAPPARTSPARASRRSHLPPLAPPARLASHAARAASRLRAPPHAPPARHSRRQLHAPPSPPPLPAGRPHPLRNQTWVLCPPPR
jgi:hypothetical protein